MTETIARIRWAGDEAGDGITLTGSAGSVGTLDPAAFHIWQPPQAGGELVLTSELPGQQNRRSFSDDPDDLKAEAERWLEEFVTSLGAVSRPKREQETCSMTADLISFLNARLDEKRQHAEGLLTHGPRDVSGLVGLSGQMLREVEAGRAIVERYERACRIPEPVMSFTAGQDDGYRQACMDAIADLAAVWSDHPDYREEWKP